jgi:hypothetical protein
LSSEHTLGGTLHAARFREPGQVHGLAGAA